MILFQHYQLHLLHLKHNSMETNMHNTFIYIYNYNRVLKIINYYFSYVSLHDSKHPNIPYFHSLSVDG